MFSSHKKYLVPNAQRQEDLLVVSLGGSEIANRLVNWYLPLQRPLPWRRDQDPYRIWLAEVMLQQTTVKAVVPYYERFLLVYPTVRKLAKASVEEVSASWAGLGYYSRVRNLHAAAKIIASNGFPETAEDLEKLPGFGPYTSRSVASFAFEQRLGVLDGNVIRFLSRLLGFEKPWWSSTGRSELQKFADHIVKKSTHRSSTINQALIEIGATICRAKSPSCMLCPFLEQCVARKKNRISLIPLARERAKTQIWLWEPILVEHHNKLGMVLQHKLPFLKKAAVFPGRARQLSSIPKKFDVRHAITRHDIFVKIKKGSLENLKSQNPTWVKIADISKLNPSSLLTKILSKAMASNLFGGLISLGLIATFGWQASAQLGVVPKAKVDPKPQLFEIKNARQITQFGWNALPRWAGAAGKLFYLSRDRADHVENQIYVWDPKVQSSKRLSFQLGGVKDFVFWSPEKIIFVGDSDDQLERPLAPPSTDLYLSDFGFFDTLRLTRRIGDDLSPRPIDPLRLLFSEVQPNGNQHLAVYSFKDSRVVPLRPGKADFQWLLPTGKDRFLALEPQDLMSFIESGKAIATWNLKFTQGYWDPDSHFAVLNSEKDWFLFNPEKRCLAPVSGPWLDSLGRTTGLALIGEKAYFSFEPEARKLSLLYQSDWKQGDCRPPLAETAKIKLKL